MMTVGKLRELMAELPEETEVRLIHQPSYPLQCGLGGEVVVVGCDDERIEELEEQLEGVVRRELDDEAQAEYDAVQGELDGLRRDGNQTSVLWIAEGSVGSGSPYGPSIVVRQLGWGR